MCYFRNVDELVRKSQQPMVNSLMIEVGTNRVLECVSQEDEACNGDGKHIGKKVRREFKEPSNDQKLVELSYKTFAVESKKKMRWAVNMYCSWRSHRLGNGPVCEEIVRANLDALSTFSQQDFSYALACFVREVKRVDGKDYPPNTLKEIVIMLQMFLHENGLYWKLLDSDAFRAFRNILDNTMKQRTAMGLGVRKSSDVISIVQEDKLFRDNILGDDEPKKLLQTVIYMLGLHLALREVSSTSVLEGQVSIAKLL